MHAIEPYYSWRAYYTAEDDPRSPFYGREYSEFEFSLSLYDHYLHPQWDDFGSQTLFIKILFADYQTGYAIIEMIGEWNDCLNNDIMFLKRDLIELLMEQGIDKFILIGENVLNFHYSDDCYYEEWFDEVNDSDGWIAALNFPDHVLKEFSQANIDSYFLLGGLLNTLEWRTLKPQALYLKVESYVARRLMST
jgi:hypothetical protein